MTLTNHEHAPEAEEGLRQSERQYRELVEGIGDILYATDRNGVLTYASPAVQTILGYTPDEVIGRPVQEFIHPDDRARQAESLSRLLGGESTSNEYRLLTRSGELRWMRTSSQAVLSAGRIVGVQGVLADITDRKLTQLRLEHQNRFLTSVLESLAHPFYVVNTADYTVAIANSAAQQTGIRTGATCYALAHGRASPCDGTEHPCAIREVQRTGKPVTLEHVHRIAGGPDQNLEVHAYPLFGEDGKVEQVIEYTLDITARKQAEQRLQEAAVAAERSRLARDLHDSVTQALFSASLVAEVLPQVWQRDPGEVMAALAELRELTRSALAEMRALLIELRPAALMESTLDALLQQLAEAITGAGDVVLRMNLQPAPPLPAEVQVTFYRVCQEALQNAVKHAGPGQVHVSLRVSPAVPEWQDGTWHGRLLLEVEDTGMGFDSAARGPEQMGLRIMRERAEGIAADLSVASSPGVGTRVSLAWKSQDPVVR